MYEFFLSRDPSPPTIRNHKQNVSCEGFLKPWIQSIIEMWEGRTWSTILSLLQAWHKPIYRFNLKTQNKQCVPGHRIGFLRKITGTNSHVYNLNAVNHKFRLCTIVHTSIFLWFTTFFKHMKILWLLLFAVPQMDIERIFRLKLHGTMQTFKIPSWSLFAVLHICLRSCVIYRQFYQWQWMNSNKSKIIPIG